MSLVESEEEIMRSVLQCLLILIIIAQAGASGAAPLTPISGFWKTWGDGNAEIAVYELSTMRYGEERKGYAIAIVVTEPWNLTKNVKSDRNKGRDIIPALKLNLIRNFQTGVYDYHTMTSAFVALQRGPQVPAHGALKLSFSAQEWCGHSFENIRFHPEKSVSLYHSYFESSTEGSQELPPLPSEDHLWLWARGFQNHALPPQLIRSSYDVRIHHKALEPIEQRVKIDGRTITISTSRGDYQFVRGRDAHSPLSGWKTPWGEKATLLDTKRLPYWRLNSARGLDDLLDLGLNSVSSRLKRSP